MRFWDSSAVVPLLIREPRSDAMLALFEADPAISVWWATPVECVAAIARRERERSASVADAAKASRRLREFAAAWSEIGAAETVRTVARRLLQVHPLRAADALQLAAGIVAAGREPSSLDFVCLDDRLADAATREGFKVVAAD